MSTALYRRYRPQAFDEVIGQEHVTDPLRAALRSGRINHAYLFSGPRGCGKTTSARILARCLNCVEGPTDTPCGKCDSCQELSTGGPGSLDVVEIDAASHNGVDDARELRERASFAPIRDRFKVFILDEAHMVTSQGFNALLKLVEEPPPHVKFVFATTEPDKVLGTIRSRTHHYPFRLVPPETMTSYLAQLCEAEKISVAEGVLPLVVRAGGGSVRDSLSVLDQLMAGALDSHVSYAGATELLGYTDAALLDAAVDALASGSGAQAFETVEKIVESGHDPRRFTEDLLHRLRDLVILAVAGTSADAIFAALPKDQLERMQQQAKLWGPAGLSRAADLTAAALTGMTGATSPRLLVELLLARILVSAEGIQTTPGATASTAPVRSAEVVSAVPAAASAQSRREQPTSKAEVDTSPGKSSHENEKPQPQQTELSAKTKADLAQRLAQRNSQRHSPDSKPAQKSDTAATLSSDAHSAPRSALTTPTASLPEQPAQAATAQTPAAEKEKLPPAEVTPAAEISAPGGVAPGPQSEVKAKWDQILQAVEAESRVAAQLLRDNAHPGPYVASTLYLVTKEPGHAAALNRPRYLPVIAHAISRVIGTELTVHAATENEMARTVSDQIAQPQPNKTAGSSAAAPGSAPLVSATPPSGTPALAIVADASSVTSTTDPVTTAADPASTSEEDDWGPVAIPGGGTQTSPSAELTPTVTGQAATPAATPVDTPVKTGNFSANPTTFAHRVESPKDSSSLDEEPLPDDPDAYLDLDEEAVLADSVDYTEDAPSAVEMVAKALGATVIAEKVEDPSSGRQN